MQTVRKFPGRVPVRIDMKKTLKKQILINYVLYA